MLMKANPVCARHRRRLSGARLPRLVVPLVLTVGLAASCQVESPKAPQGIWLTEIGSGPPTVIMLHGGPGLTHRYLRPEWDRLADQTRVVYYDQRGCGWSERTDSVSWARHVADLDSIVTSVRDDGPVVLAGSSWGSILAVLHAYTHPGRVAGLVLSGVPDLQGTFLPFEWMGTPALLQDTALARIRSRAGTGVGTNRPIEVRVDSTVRYGDSTVFYLADSSTTNRRVVARRIPIPVRDSAEVAADTVAILPALAARMGMACPSATTPVRTSLQTAPPLDSLARIVTPILIVRGEDVTVVGDGSQELAEVLPDARVETLQGAGHDPWFEQPDSFFPLVRAFLSGCQGSRCGT